MPHATVATTLPVFISTREIVPSPWFSVQTDPSPTVRKRGVGPTAMVETTLFVLGSIFSSALPAEELTHTNPPPNAGFSLPAGRSRLFVTVLVFGSIRTSRLGFVTNHTEPSPIVIPPSLLAGSAGIVAVAFPVF